MTASLKLPLLTLAALGAVIATPALAHRAWMIPSATVLSGDDPWVEVDAAISNDLFFPDHRPMAVAAIVITAPDGSKAQAENAVTGKYRSTFDVHLQTPGTYKMATASDSLNASYKLNGETKRWRGSKEDFATQIPAGAQDLKVSQGQNRNEIFVTRGAPTRTVLQPTNSGLELSPVTHPNDLFAGEAAEFKLLLDGKPASNVDVTVVPGASRYRDTSGEMKLKTDAAGAFKVTWPEAGMYWMNASVRDDKATVANATRNASYTATFEVLKP